MYLSSLILSLVTTTIIGYLVFLIFKIRLGWSRMSKLALSFLIGSGVISLEMLLLSVFNIGLTLTNILLPLVVLLLIFFLLNIKIIKPKQKPIDSKPKYSSNVFKIFVVIIIVIIAFSFMLAYFSPLRAWDTWANWGFKANVFFQEKTIPSQFFLNPQYSYTLPNYPLLVPLNQTWMYLFIDEVNDQAVKILHAVYFLAIILIFYEITKNILGKLIGIISTCCLATTPALVEFSTIGWGADIPFASFLLCTAIFFYLWLESKCRDRNYLILFSLFAGIITWTKDKGLIVALVILLLMIFNSIYQHRKTKIVLSQISTYLLVAAIYILPWRIYQLYYSPPTNLSITSYTALEFNLDKTLFILNNFLIEMFNLKNWGILWILSAILFLVLIKYITKLNRSYVYIILLPITLGAIQFVNYFSAADVNWLIISSIERFFLQITPLAFFILVLSYQMIKVNKSSKIIEN
jgi:4-amino-4-deoxy-L-arabinose transferase-like glycosyltransferase